jgi:hypothetical protein
MQGKSAELWSNYRFRPLRACIGVPLKTIQKSAKLANVCYDIRGPIMDRARQMEDDGQKNHQTEHRQPGGIRF